MAAGGARDTLDILIVEDDEDTRQSLRDILELDEHRVATVGTAKAVLEPAEALAAFDVILLDRRLPDGLAEDLLPRFRARAPHSDVIVVTGYADLEASIAALRHGVTDYIIKPINPGALLASLGRIAQRRRIERELQAERRFAETVLQTAEAIVLVLDCDGRIARCNPYLADLTGYSLEELVARDWFDTFIPERDRADIRDVFQRTLADRETRGVSNPIVTKTGGERQIRWSNTTIKDSSGTATGVLSVGLDVTDLMEAQAQVLQSERLATIGQTITGLAHESRNALQRILNAVGLLEDDLADNEQALRDVAKIARAANDLRDLLEEVRAYASPIKLDSAPTFLPAVWRRAWESLEARYPHHKAVLIEEALNDRTPTSHADARRLQQVFRNLFENAFDACGVDTEVRVTYQTNLESIRVTVHDNGPGMPEQHRHRAFEAFYTTKPTGTGLGLAIVHRIIEAHGGTIDIENAGRGTKVVIELPIQRGSHSHGGRADP